MPHAVPRLLTAMLLPQVQRAELLFLSLDLATI
jgi:hypothetical protein